LKAQPHTADHHQIFDETPAARIQSTCLTRTVPHKICAAARTNTPLFTESKATQNPTTIVSDPSHNSNKQYCQLKLGNIKCHTLYMQASTASLYQKTLTDNGNLTKGTHASQSSFSGTGEDFIVLLGVQFLVPGLLNADGEGL
jgi:hypothetical protein